MRYAFAALLAAGMATFIGAAPPHVPGKVITTAGGRAVIEIEAPKPGDPIAWKEAFNAEDCFVDELKPLRPDTTRLIILPNKSGVYRIVVWSGPLKSDSDVVLIDATGGKPEPVVDPVKPDPVKPDPVKPDPVTKKADKVTVVVVEETFKRTRDQAKVLFDKPFRDYLKAGGHQFELIDKDDPAAKTAGYLPYVERYGVPVVLVFDSAATGAVVPLKVTKLPTTAEELTNTVKEYVK